MRLPRHVDIIGSALTIWYFPTKFRRASQLDFFSDRHALAINHTSTVLFAFPIFGSEKTHKETHFKIPKIVLKPIGNASQIMWRWEEIDQTLLHKWDEEKPKIYADRKTNPRVIAIKHARGIIFNEEGII